MNMSAEPQPRITPEGYLERDRAAEFRSEYYAGRVVEKQGGSWVHATIVHNFSRRLGNALDGRPCFAAAIQMRLRVAPNVYAYPDVLVVCDEPTFQDRHQDVLLNPVLIIEVLSPSSEACDRGFKATHYRRMPSLQELVLVAQDEPRVEIYRRQPSNEWLLSESIGADSNCRFDSLQCSIATAQIYENVTFEPLFPQPLSPEDRPPN
jgi:Uma2 family endonuclease